MMRKTLGESFVSLVQACGGTSRVSAMPRGGFRNLGFLAPNRFRGNVQFRCASSMGGLDT